VFQKTNNDDSEHLGSDEDQQLANFQPESYGSRVEETQFQSIELYSQAMCDPSFPDIRRNSQLREEANISMAPLDASSDAIQLLSRPNVDYSIDPAAGFTFARANKSSIGKFNRQPVLVKPNHIPGQPSDEDQPDGKCRY
jgi:hypothetical protein